MPPGSAWERDNTGLQAGSPEAEIKNILLCLDANEKIPDEAARLNCNLIITHHPLIYQPIKKLNTDKHKTARIIRSLIKKDITLYSAHTNYDFTKYGVSFQLAEKIGLKEIKFLKGLDASQVKVTVYVPEKNAKEVSEAIFAAGAGRIGEYERCSYRTYGTGTFQGSDTSNPQIGEKNVYEETPELRIETIAEEWKIPEIIKAIYKSHPYEEPAFDIYPLKNRSVNFGFGAAGTLSQPEEPEAFLKRISSVLNLSGLRYCSGKNGKISKVAVCGGSGSELLNNAIDGDFDAFITADIKYHTFQDAEDKIMLIDAGHYETEIQGISGMKKYLEELISESGKDIKVFETTENTNPIKFIHI